MAEGCVHTDSPYQAKSAWDAVHFLMDKIKGSDELMEVLHTVMYKRKGQVGFIASSPPRSPPPVPHPQAKNTL